MNLSYHSSFPSLLNMGLYGTINCPEKLIPYCDKLRAVMKFRRSQPQLEISWEYRNEVQVDHSNNAEYDVISRQFMILYDPETNKRYPMLCIKKFDGVDSGKVLDKLSQDNPTIELYI